MSSKESSLPAELQVVLDTLSAVDETSLDEGRSRLVNTLRTIESQSAADIARIDVERRFGYVPLADEPVAGALKDLDEILGTFVIGDKQKPRFCWACRRPL